MKLALLKSPMNRTATILGFFTSILDLELIELLDSKILEEKYFKEGNNIIGRVNGTYCIAYAKK